MSKFQIPLFILFILFADQAPCQIDDAFIAHLSEHELKQEHWQYLSDSDVQNDTLEYYRAKFHLQYGNDSLFFNSYKHCQSLFLQDTNAVLLSHHHFLTSLYGHTKMWFSEFTAGSNNLTGIPLIFQSVEHPEEVQAELLPQTLRQDFLKFKKYEHKKPLVGASLSALVPGSGKLYIGNKGSFILTFTSLAVIGLQTWESYRQLGIEHPLTIVGGSLFTIYYGVNVLGSFRAVKEKKKQVRYQYLINASNYYHSLSHTPLY